MNNQWLELNNIDSVFNNIALLLVNNDTIAKCLYYNSEDALSKTAPTQDQKFSLVKQLSPECRIFNVSPSYLVTKETRAEIRMYESAIVSENAYIAEVEYCFVVIAHQRIWNLNEGKRRAMVIANEILKTLNGAEVGGIGYMRFFSDDPTPVLQYVEINEDFLGYEITGYLRLSDAE
jgi:hypothetical protein